MQPYRFALILIAIFSIYGCNSSSGGNTNNNSSLQPELVVTPVAIINDINCNVSYPLNIANVYQDTVTSSIPTLFDGDKTNASNWTAPSVDQELIVELASPALLKQLLITWQDTINTQLFSVSASKDRTHWSLLNTPTQSTKNTIIPDVIELAGNAATAKYIKISLQGNELSLPNQLLELELFGCSQNISHTVELIDWYLSVPTDTDNNGKSDSIKETDLAEGYFDPRFFYHSADGGIVFSTSVSGYRTSTNTKYVRSELREMLRRGNTSYSTQGVSKNNWVFSSAPQQDLTNAGGIDGELTAELSVNHVTTTGESYQIGRVIIGQIHANDDEPVRLYYRKLANNTNGSIYIAHEILNGDDVYYELIGDRGNSAANPTNGIALNERFSYIIHVEGDNLTVSVTKADGTMFTQSVDMSNSGYDQGGQYMYFKAGVYNQNNSGDQHDYVKATFYRIENSHTNYLN